MVREGGVLEKGSPGYGVGCWVCIYKLYGRCGDVGIGNKKQIQLLRWHFLSTLAFALVIYLESSETIALFPQLRNWGLSALARYSNL